VSQDRFSPGAQRSRHGVGISCATDPRGWRHDGSLDVPFSAGMRTSGLKPPHPQPPLGAPPDLASQAPSLPQSPAGPKVSPVNDLLLPLRPAHLGHIHRLGRYRQASRTLAHRHPAQPLVDSGPPPVDHTGLQTHAAAEQITEDRPYAAPRSPSPPPTTSPTHARPENRWDVRQTASTEQQDPARLSSQ